MRSSLALFAILLIAQPGGASAQRAESNFNHPKHQRVFPTCVTCHAGAAVAGESLWPDSGACASCHNGTIQKTISWQPPTERDRNNLRFAHAVHDSAATAAAARQPAGALVERPACVSCHTELNAPRMAVRLAAVQRCLDCHGVSAPHLAAPDTACARCHLPLSRAARLTVRDVAAFPAPPSHRQPTFLDARGHGAQAAARTPVAESCATCHARDFCVQCHVNAPEQRTIQALEPDTRSLALAAHLKAPASHAAPAFIAGHGALARTTIQQCAACHTQESCLTCHATLTRVAANLPRAGAGRGIGAKVTRRPPTSHGESYSRAHKADANALPQSCAGCHVRSDCLSCHRPDPARAAGYHPGGFLVRHPASAYAREASCADCHNTAGFCVSCHVSAGLVASSPLRGGYHDASRFFIAGHGGAARQSLETCVSCHAERDCLTCHSATGGRRFNPHGPGFDPRRLAKKNSQMCSACHGAAIPQR